MPFNLESLAKARSQGYTDDQISSHLEQSDERFRVAKQQGYSLDDIATHLTKGGVKQNEQNQPQSYSDRNAGREANQQVQPTDEAGIQPVEVRLPESQGQKQRVGSVNASRQVTGEPSEAITQTESQPSLQGQEGGQAVRTKVPSGNQEEVVAGGVQPPKGYVGRLVSGITEKPKEAAKVAGSAVAETGAGLAGGTIAAALMSPIAAGITAGTGGLAAPLAAGLEMAAFAGGSYVGSKAAKLIEGAIGVDKDIEKAQQAQPELAQVAGVATMLPMGVKSVAGLAKLTGKEALKRVAGGAVGGAAFEPIRYGVEKGIQAATGGEEEVAPITAESVGESALIGAALSGMGARKIAREVGPETAKVAATQLTDDAIAKKFEETPAKPLTLEPIAEKPAGAPAEAQPTKPSETEVKEASGLPTLEGKPTIPETAVKTEEGTPQREGEGEEEVISTTEPTKPEPIAPEGTRVYSAAYMAPNGVVYEGKSHPEAMEKAKEAGAITQEEVDAKKDAASRNTDEFGYNVILPSGEKVTTTREAGGQIARASGQAKKEQFDFGEKMHSNESELDINKTPSATIPPPPEGTKPVMRGVSEKISEAKDTTEAQKYYIQADELVKRKKLPDEIANEWVESIPKEHLESIFNKAMESIGSDENLSRLRVRLGARLANEKFASGDDAGGADIINGIAQTASDAASVLRSVQFLYKGTPVGFVKLAEKLAEKAGVELRPEATTKIQSLADDFLSKKKSYENAADNAQNASTKKQFNSKLKEMRKFQSSALKSQNELYGYVDSLFPKSLSKEVYPALLKGNLLTPISLATNIQANALRTIVDIPSMSLASGFDLARSLLTGSKREFVFGPQEIYQYLKTISKGAPSIVSNTIKSILGRDLDVGSVTDKTEIKRRLSPLSAVKRLISTSDKRMYDGEYTFSNRAADFAEATFGVPANLFFDLLAVGDKPFREASKSMSASSLARQLGISGLDYHKFLEMPEKGIKEYANRQGKTKEESFEIKTKLLNDLKSEASKGVFEQENKVANSIINGLNKLDSIPVIGVIARATIPYVKTPLNVIDEVMQYTVWPYSMYRVTKAAKQGNIRETQQILGKAIIGMIASYAAAYLYKNNVLTAPADPRSKEQELGYATIPSSSINISGIKRLINGESSDPQSGDKILRADKLGLVGAILVTSAMRQKKRDELQMIGEDKSIYGRFANEIANVVPKVLSFSLNQTFLKGTNDLLQSLVRGEGDKWAKGVFGAASSAFIPNTFSAISRSMREYMPNVQDDSFYKSLENTIRDRFGFAGAMKDVMPRVDFWGRPVKQTPEGANPILYNFLDMSKSRDIPNDPVSLEMLHLFHATGDKDIIPSSPQNSYTLRNKTYGLTPEEYNKFSTMIGKERKRLIENIVSSPSYLKMTDETKAMIWKKMIDKGSAIARKRFERDVVNSGGFRGEVKKLSPKETEERIKQLNAERSARD